MNQFDIAHTKSEYRDKNAALLVENSKVVLLSKPENGTVKVCKYGYYNQSLIIPISILKA